MVSKPLEARLPELPTKLSHDFETEEGDHTVVYRGTAFNLSFDSLDIKGGVSLEKIDGENAQTAPVENGVWKISTESNHSYFVNDGGSNLGRAIGVYRALLTEASKIGLTLSPFLLRPVFYPIDAELMDFYRQARDSVRQE